MNQFRMIESAAPQQVRISWQMRTPRDDSSDRPDEMDDGFWPSLNPDDAGYIGDADPSDVNLVAHNLRFDVAMQKAEERMDAWKADDWHYVGVVARAHVFVPIGGGSFATYTLDSPGLWGIESDAGDYLRSVFEEQKAELRGHLATMARAFIAPDAFTEEDAE